MIDWMSFVIVFVASIASAITLVALYSLGIRFLATPPRAHAGPTPGSVPRDDEDDDVDPLGRPRWATIAAYACFALSAAGVLFGIYLIVPALHG
jgi:Sec-independent protein secretion pathway component TatC